MTDYSLWEVILNGDSPVPTRVVEGVLQPVAPTTTEQKLAKKNELKPHGTLLMPLPDKHQLKFKSHKDAKTLMEAIEKRFGGNTETKKVQKTLLKQQYENFIGSHSESLDQIHDMLQKLTHTLIWRNKADLKEQSLDDLFNSLKIYEAKVKHSSSTCTTTQNLAFVSSSNTDSTTDLFSVAASASAVCAKMPVSSLSNVDSLSNAVIYSLFASQSTSPQLDNEDLKHIDVDDLEEMHLRWQMAMLTMRAKIFLQKTGRNPRANGPTSIGFDMSKVKCYSCHRKGHFARECRFQPNDGYHAVPPPYTGTFMIPKPNLVFNIAPTAVETDHSAFTVQLSPTKPEQALSHTNRLTTPIIEDCHVKTSILAAAPKPASLKPVSSGKRRNRKACFVCKSVDHLIKDCDYHAKKMAQPTPRNHAHRGNHKQYAPLTHTNPQKHMVLAAVLTQSKPVSITTVRPVSVVVPKIKVTRPRHVNLFVTKSKSLIRRYLTRSQSPVTSNSPPRVTAVKALVGNPQHALKNKGVIDSGCSRHMTRNMSYLSYFEELNYGYVAFRGNPKGGKISRKGKIKTGKFDRKVDRGFLVGYSVNSKAFRVFNSRTRIVQETLHVIILAEKPLLKDPDCEDVDVHTYRSMIGSLMYLTSSRPDIMFTCKKQTVVATLSTEAEYVVNDIIRLQALVDKKKVVVTKAIIREAFRLDDAEGVDCLPNKEIFTELARMGYEKPSTKLMFYKSFFSSQWKFLIHTILQCMRDADEHVEEVNAGDAAHGDDSAAHGEVPTVTAEPSIPSHTSPTPPPHQPQDIPSTSQEQQTPPQSPLVQPPSPQHQLPPQQAADFPMSLLQEAMDACAALTRRVEHLKYNKVAQALEITKLKKGVGTSDDTVMDDESNQGRMIAEMDQDDVVVLKDDKEEDKEVADAVKEVEEAKEDKTEPVEVQEVVDVVTTAKLIIEVVIAASETVTDASVIVTAAKAQNPAATLTAAHARIVAAPSRRKKRVVIRDPESESTTSIIIPAETKSKDKGKGILVEEPKPLKTKQQIELDEQYARELHAELNKDIDWDKAIDHVKRKAKEDPAVKRYQVLKRKPQTEAQARKNMLMYLKNVVGFKMDYFKGMSYDDIQRAAKRRKLDEDVEDPRRHLQIVPNEDDDVYTEATPLARKEKVSTTKPKNFSEDLLLVILGAMFEKPDIHAQIWKTQRNKHGPTKVKGWKLLESCGVQIITFTSTQLILLVESKYPLTRFTLDQMLNVVRLEVEEDSEVSLELLRFIRQQHQEGQHE
nr:hypothetical protein [Tanacetum cinerariifolium]